MIKVSIARHHDTMIAVNNVLEQCEAHSAALLLVFAARRHNPEQILTAVQSMAPGVTVFGGSVVGTITRDVASYGGYEFAAIAFHPGPDLPQVVAADPCETTDVAIGRSLGNAIVTASSNLQAVLLFYTSVANVASRQLHHGTDILAGLLDGLGAINIDVAGGGLLTGFDFDDSWIITPDGVRKHGAFAVVFPPHLRLETCVLGACCPIGLPMTITAIDGARVLSFDGLPALDALCTLLQRKPSSNGNILSLNLCLGLFNPPSAKIYGESRDVIRVIVSEDVNTHSICLLEPDFSVGDQVRFMLRDNDYMMSSARVIGSKTDSRSIMSVYIDCAGRASILTGTQEEEGVVAMSGLPADIPALGLYSGVEIASINQVPRSLDLTGVMVSIVKS